MDTKVQAENYHIHEVLNALYQDQRPFSMTDLKGFIADKFGASARFFSCSLHDMDIDQAIEFMTVRSKIIEIEPGKFQLNVESQCHH